MVGVVPAETGIGQDLGRVPRRSPDSRCAQRVNSSGPSVMGRLYNRCASEFCWHVDERRLDHLALERAAADVDVDRGAVGDVGVGVDQRQRDTDFQRRRERSRRGDADRRGVAVEHRQVRPAARPRPTARRPRSSRRGPACFSASSASRPQNASFFQPIGPPAARLQRRDVQRQFVAVQRVAHLGAQGVAGAETGQLAAGGADRGDQRVEHHRRASPTAAAVRSRARRCSRCGRPAPARRRTRRRRSPCSPCRSAGRARRAPRPTCGPCTASTA